MKNFKDYLIKKLKLYSKKDIIISSHAKIRMVQRQIEIIPKNNFFIIKFLFILKNKEELLAPIMIPSINEPSPASIA